MHTLLAACSSSEAEHRDSDALVYASDGSLDGARDDGAVSIVDSGVDASASDAGVDAGVPALDAGVDSGAVGIDAGADSGTPDAGPAVHHYAVEIMGYHIPEFRRRIAQPTVWKYHDPNAVAAGREAPDVRPSGGITDHEANSYDFAVGSAPRWTIDVGSSSPAILGNQYAIVLSDVEGLGDYVGDTVAGTETIGVCGAAQWMTEAEVVDSLANGTIYTASCTQPTVGGFPALGDFAPGSTTSVVEAPLVIQWRVVELP